MYGPGSECGDCAHATEGQKVKELDRIEIERTEKEQEMKSWLVQEELALLWVISENSYRLVGESYQEGNVRKENYHDHVTYYRG